MISKTGIHATLALAFLSQLDSDEFAGATQIANKVGAPPNYLGKLLKQLAEEGLVISQKGFGGGFKLAKPADKITVYDVLEPIEKVSKWNGCFLGRSQCSEKSPCSVHTRWSKVREDYLSFLKETTIKEVAK
ncbi:MAG: Rrf2 family transcriptional regulator [Calditrichaeota bacterium]|nr:MAG: Rrf2 family transcriptional regulator [Calditrichota bacterium]